MGKTIHDLSQADQLAPDDEFPLWDASARGTRRAQMSMLADMASADLAGDDGANKIGGTWFGNVKAKLSQLASSIGASLIGYGNESVAAAIDGIKAQVRTDSPLTAAMFCREKFVEVPFRDATYDQLKATYNYDFLYAQSFALDLEANELWILKASSTGNNSWAWIWVHDLATRAVKTVFTTGQQWRETLILRRVGAVRYMYTIGSGNAVIRLDVTNLPAMLSTVAPVDTYPVVAQSHMAFDGASWFVQDNYASRGQTRRHRFKVYNEDFSEQTGEMILPLDGVGTLQAYTNYFPKAQGITFHRGVIYVACGGDYNSSSAGSSALRYKPIKQQGIQAFTTTGEKLGTALCDPELYRNLLAQLAGHTCTVTETEGVYSAGGELYSIWQTLSPSEWAGARGLTEGIVIAREFAKGPNRVDFSPAASAVRSPINIDDFQSEIHHSSIALKNPITGGDLNTFQLIMSMMNDLDIARYAFSGANQVLSDLNGADLDLAGKVIEALNFNGSTFQFRIRGGNAEQVYTVAGGAQTLDGMQVGGTPSSALNGVIVAPGGNGKVATGRTTTAQAAHYEFWNPNGVVGTISPIGTNTRYYISASRFITGGTGTPEGVVTAPVGSLFLREDGGAGTTLYIKQTGTGNTGWAAK